jgi:hypothetical protein
MIPGSTKSGKLKRRPLTSSIFVMPLKFPQVRLMVYDSLVNDGKGCVQALVSCAHELGLIGGTKLTTLRLPIETPDCGSLFAAQHVLEQCLSERGYCLNNGDRQLADRLWDNVKRKVETYKQKTSLEHARQAGKEASTIECSHMAPIVMDYLLQELQPYI